MTADTPRLRLGIVGIIALSLFAALLTRLWYLQVLSAPEFRLQAAANSIRTVDDPAPRGRILDRNGKVLVDNRASNVVAIDRSKLTKDEKPVVLKRLSTVLGVGVDVLSKRLDDQRVSPYTPVPVAADVTEDKMVRLLERSDEFPAVVAKRVAVRTYPMGNIAPHVLGYVGEATQNDIDNSSGSLHLGDEIGKSGVEFEYDRDLRGAPGQEQIEVDASGKPIRVVNRKAPVQGNDIVLSIDADVQHLAENSLAQGLAAAHGRSFQDTKKPLVADAGAVVVLDTKGAVVALASYPTFDLPSIANGITTEEAKVLFGANTGAPFFDRAVQGLFAPGSTWKLVTADAALRSGLITPNFSLVDTGTYTIPGDCTGSACIKHNAGSEAWGRVGVSRALTVSSDVFFYTLGAQFWSNRKQLGDDVIQRQAEQYGFGQITGIPLPAEAAGRVLTPKMKADLAAKNSPLVDGPYWYTGNNVSLAIGQESMVVTPIQIANAYATFANNGDRYQPNIALKIQRQDGTVVREITPRVAAHVDIPGPIHSAILTGLEGAVSDVKGTAFNAFDGFPLDKWRVAGKTGTAQAPPKQDTALFVGFGPATNPQYVVAVVMEQSGFGATSAAPVARRLFGQLSGLETGPGAVQFVQANGAGD